MTQEYLSDQKDTIKKYKKISRTTQIEIVQQVEGGSTQEAAANTYNLPRTTVEHWIKRKRELKGRCDPIIVSFFESSVGLAFLHRLLTAIYLLFHKMGACGLPLIHKFLEISGLSSFVGSSVGSLHKISRQIDKLLKEFGLEERARLAAQMPHKKITGCGDETFFNEQMIVVFMEALSGYILNEQEEEKRDALAWEKVTKRALEGLNVELIQVAGDEAGGLTSCVKNLLGVHKSPDLFHIQQDITKGLTGHLARRVRQAEDALKYSLESQKTGFEQIQKKLEKVGTSIEDPSVVKKCKKVLAMRDQEVSCRKHLEKVKREQETARDARRSISENYHPIELKTGLKRTPEQLKQELKGSFNELETIACEAECTDNQKKKLAKSKGMLETMVQTLAFFWCIVNGLISDLRLDAKEVVLFEQFLLPIEYLKIVEQRSGKQEGETARKTWQELEQRLHHNRDGPPKIQREEELRQKAIECAQFFQRSSSCVEGRNGVLSLRHHASRQLSPEKLASLTVLHNFFIERKDKTTAAERFFQQKPRDLFMWLLDRVSWPVRPRNWGYSRISKDGEQLAA